MAYFDLLERARLAHVRPGRQLLVPAVRRQVLEARERGHGQLAGGGVIRLERALEQRRSIALRREERPTCPQGVSESQREPARNSKIGGSGGMGGQAAEHGAPLVSS